MMMLPMSPRRVALLVGVAVLVSGLSVQAVNAALLGEYTFETNDNASYGAGYDSSLLTFGTFTRTGLSASSANTGGDADGSSFVSEGWHTGNSMNAGQYVGFTVDAAAGYRLDLTSINFDHWRSHGPGNNRGPQAAQVSYTTDGDPASEAFTPGDGWAKAHSWDFNDVLSADEPVEFRFHGWDAGGGQRHMALDNVQVYGDITALARMSVSADPLPAAVIRHTAVNFAFSVGNDLANPNVGQDALSYTYTVTGRANGAGGNSALQANTSDNASLAIDTSAAGQVGMTLQVSSDNAYATNGVTNQNSFSETYSLNVFAPSNAVFTNARGANDASITNGGKTLTLDFGTVILHETAAASFDLLNELDVLSYTAGLDLTALTGTGDTGIFGLTGLTSFANLLAGSVENYAVSFDTAAEGTYLATYVFEVADDANILGGGVDELTLVVTGTVIPEPGTLLLLTAGTLTLVVRTRKTPAASAG